MARGASRHPLLGSHVSVAGGLHEGVSRLAALRFGNGRRARALQVFTKNSSQWVGKPVTAEAAAAFRAARAEHGVEYCAAHSSYLINLAAEGEMGKKSRAAFVDEIERCEAYGIEDLVFHPGAHLGTGVTPGLKRVAAAMDGALKATAGSSVRLLIEMTAGQGTCLGWRLEEIRDLLDLLGAPRPRVAICVDTCHMHAAGYDLSKEETAAQALDDLDRTIGAGAIALFHINDAKKPCGSRVDRHEHIGRGTIGLAGFRVLARDTRFRAIPKVLETEKGSDEATGREWDEVNLEELATAGM